MIATAFSYFIIETTPLTKGTKGLPRMIRHNLVIQ